MVLGGGLGWEAKADPGTGDCAGPAASSRHFPCGSSRIGLHSTPRSLHPPGGTALQGLLGPTHSRPPLPPHCTPVSCTAWTGAEGALGRRPRPWGG